MVDAKRRPSRMRRIGGEDRALLRSNPSARSDAGTGTGAPSLMMLPSTPACSGHKAPNLGGPGAAPPRLSQPARCAIWQHRMGRNGIDDGVPRAYGRTPLCPPLERGEAGCVQAPRRGYDFAVAGGGTYGFGHRGQRCGTSSWACGRTPLCPPLERGEAGRAPACAVPGTADRRLGIDGVRFVQAPALVGGRRWGGRLRS